MEKCPLAVNGVTGRNTLETILASGKQSGSIVDHTLKQHSQYDKKNTEA